MKFDEVNDKIATLEHKIDTLSDLVRQVVTSSAASSSGSKSSFFGGKK